MVLLKRFFCLAILALLVCDTQSLPKIAFTSESESSTDLKHLQVQDYLENATKQCHGKAEDIAAYISKLDKLIVNTAYKRLDKLFTLLNSFERTEQRNAASQVKALKKRVKHEAAQALCPVPDDPSLMGELDVIIDLIYEMCNFNFIEEAESIRESASDRMERLLTRIQSVLESVQLSAVNPRKACTELVSDVQAELEEIQEMEAIYEVKVKSVYSMCFQMAYEHAESYMPSIVKIATSCRMEKRTIHSSNIQKTK